MKEKLTGFILCSTIALFSVWGQKYAPYLGSVSLCLLIGLFIKPKPGIKFISQNCLTAAVILLGFNLKFDFLQQLGLPILLLLASIVVLSITASLLFAKLLRIDNETALLIGIGSGICGTSAIATTSNLVTDDQDKVASSLGVVNFVGIVALVILPIFANFFGLAPSKSSLLLGGSLQSVGHVAAAGGILGGVVLQSSLSIKMARVFFLLPTAMYFSFANDRLKSHWLKKVPIYLWGFIAAVLISNSGLTTEPMLQNISLVGKALLLIAMVGIGCEIELKKFFRQAPKLILLAVFIQLIQIILISPFLF